MIINRTWSMPNKNTFSIKPIKELITRYIDEKQIWVDPFARDSIFKQQCTYTNDLDPNFNTTHCMESLEFLKQIASESTDGVLFDPPYCYDDDTEVFTQTGWKLLRELTYEDVIATLNTKNNQLEYHRPIEIIRKEYQGDMYELKSQSIDLLVTPNHRMWIKDSFYNDFKFQEVKDITNKNIWFNKSCVWEGKEEEFFSLPEVTFERHNRYGEKGKDTKLIPMDLWLRFFGYFISEGCCVNGKKTKDYKVSISQKKECNRNEIKEIITEIGYNSLDDGINIVIYDKQLYSYLNQFGKTNDKFIPKELMSLSSRQLSILMGTLMKGDGTNITYSKLNIKANKMYPYTTRSYYTNSEKLMNCVSEIGIKMGFGITATEKYKKGYKNVYCIHFLGAKNFKYETKNTRIVQYHGYINCVTVPNSTLLVKRKGKVCWCGNSPRQISECYKSVGKQVHMQDTQSSFYGDRKKEVARIVKQGGIVISCCWNSGGIGKTLGFEIAEILLVPHGGNHNDTIVTVERKLVI